MSRIPNISDHVSSTNSIDSTILNKINFKLTAEQIKTQTEILKNQVYQKVADIAAIPEDLITFESVVVACANLAVPFNALCTSLTFPQHVSTDESVREASREAEEIINKMWTDIGMNQDIYQQYQKLLTKIDLNSLDPQDRLLLDEDLRSFKRLGFNLSKEDQQSLKDLFDTNSEFEVKHSAITADDKSFLIFTKDELAGLSEDYLERTKQEDGTGEELFKVTREYPDVGPIGKDCSVSETRHKVSQMVAESCSENGPILVKLLQVRAAIAKLLGYPTWNHYQTEVLMTKNPNTVNTLLQNLLTKMHPGVVDYLSRMKEFSGVNELNSWDISYYHHQMLKQLYQVDHQELRKWFPLEHVLSGMIKLYSELFGIHIEELKGATEFNGIEIWHPDVRIFTFTDANTKEYLGSCWLDLHPREGKYNHACESTLISGCNNSAIGKVHPFAALLCNFTSPIKSSNGNKDIPSLLTWDEVETLFHEAGHCLHEILGSINVRYSGFSGTSVKQDYVEAPSQMLEQWLTSTEVVQRISKHYETGEPLSEDTLNKLIASSKFGETLSWTRTVSMAHFDQVIHGLNAVKREDETDITPKYLFELWSKLLEPWYTYKPTKGSYINTWSHLGSRDYSGAYYSYVLSIVIACDLYSRFDQNNASPINPDIGIMYRREILEPGGTIDPEIMIANFLGRPYNEDAFLKRIGL